VWVEAWTFGRKREAKRRTSKRRHYAKDGASAFTGLQEVVARRITECQPGKARFEFVDVGGKL
jgi:hypothetical protein